MGAGGGNFSLETDKQFKKYQVITLEVSKGSDTRIETYKPNTETIVLGDVLGTTGKAGWRDRQAIVNPRVGPSLCELQRRQQTDGLSLGAFRPAKVTDFYWESLDQKAIKQKTLTVAQLSLLAPMKSPLEILPYRFKYKFQCSDPNCSKHDMTCVDWEVGQAYRRFVRKYGAARALQEMRRTFLDKMCGSDKDTVFYAGNTFEHRNVFLILGVFWPPLGSTSG